MKDAMPIPQEKLNEIWDSLDTENPHFGAKKVVDDEVEQVMSLPLNGDRTFAVRRRPGTPWVPVPG